MNKPSLIINNLSFYDAPSSIEGSPYWVDLWGSVNGYRIGLQVKPKTYNSASISIYAGKTKSSQLSGHKKFRQEFGGRVFIVMPGCNGEIDEKTSKEIKDEIERLKSLPVGSYPELF